MENKTEIWQISRNLVNSYFLSNYPHEEYSLKERLNSSLSEFPVNKFNDLDVILKPKNYKFRFGEILLNNECEMNAGSAVLQQFEAKSLELLRELEPAARANWVVSGGRLRGHYIDLREDISYLSRSIVGYTLIPEFIWEGNGTLKLPNRGKFLRNTSAFVRLYDCSLINRNQAIANIIELLFIFTQSSSGGLITVKHEAPYQGLLDVNERFKIRDFNRMRDRDEISL